MTAMHIRFQKMALNCPLADNAVEIPPGLIWKTYKVVRMALAVYQVNGQAYWHVAAGSCNIQLGIGLTPLSYLMPDVIKNLRHLCKQTLRNVGVIEKDYWFSNTEFTLQLRRPLKDEELRQLPERFKRREACIAAIK